MLIWVDEESTRAGSGSEGGSESLGVSSCSAGRRSTIAGETGDGVGDQSDEIIGRGTKEGYFGSSTFEVEGDQGVYALRDFGGIEGGLGEFNGGTKRLVLTSMSFVNWSTCDLFLLESCDNSS